MREPLSDQDLPTPTSTKEKSNLLIKKRLISTIILLIYCAILIKVMVFKDVPTIRIGVVMFNFAGTNGDNPPNFVPLMTILPYLLGHKGLLIGGLNLVGNIVFLIPIGLLIPFVYRNITRKKSLVFAVIAGLVIEVMQVVLHVGIFDIDDVILNAVGVMIGYGAITLLLEWVLSKRYKTIIITASIVTITTAAIATLFVGDVLQQSRQPVRFKPNVNSDQTDNITDEASEIPQDEDLCGGTGGNGQIVSVENNSFILKRNDDGSNQIIHLTAQAEIKTSTGSSPLSDLKTGDKVTLVGGPNPDGSFTADAVFVCNG